MVYVPHIRLPDRLMTSTTPNYGRDRIEQGNSRDHQGHEHDHEALRADDTRNGDDAHHQAEEQSPRIPHENRSWKEIEPQKRQAHGDERNAGQCERRATAHYHQIQKACRHDGDDARCQAIQPIDKIRDVDEHHQVENRQRVVEPSKIDVVAIDDRPNRSYRNARSRNHNGSDDLPEKLRQSRHLNDVVDKAHGEHDGDADEQHNVIDILKDVKIDDFPPEEPFRNKYGQACSYKPDIQGNAPAPRHGVGVEPSIAGVVDRPDENGNFLRRRHHKVSDDKRHEKHR